MKPTRGGFVTPEGPVRSRTSLPPFRMRRYRGQLVPVHQPSKHAGSKKQRKRK